MPNSPNGTPGSTRPTSSVKVRPHGVPRRQRTGGGSPSHLAVREGYRESLSDVERLRRAVIANIGGSQTIELVLEEPIGEASPDQLGGPMRWLTVVEAHAEEVKAWFGPFDGNVANIALVGEFRV